MEYVHRWKTFAYDVSEPAAMGLAQSILLELETSSAFTRGWRETVMADCVGPARVSLRLLRMRMPKLEPPFRKTGR